MKNTALALLGLVLIAAAAQAQVSQPGMEGIQEIVDVVDEVAQEPAVVPPPAPVDGAAPETLPALPLGNAPPGTDGGEVMLSAEMTPIDLAAPVRLEDLPSLFFTFWEHNAIKDARNARGVARGTTDSELMLPEGEPLERIKPPPEEREIKLGGIVYTRGGDWTIWLNSKRITPDALPREIVELRVYKEYIELKWLDEYTQQIFPIRLRPHQRFNLDSRIFLPG
jgi:hypothetical protein